MPKNKKMPRRVSNPDFRHRSDFPIPPVEEIEQRLMEVLTPGAFAPLRMPDQADKLRERILTLSVMTAMMVSLVWRRLPSLTEVLRVLAREGFWWVEALSVSKQARSQRLAAGASLFVCARVSGGDLPDPNHARFSPASPPRSRVVGAGAGAFSCHLDYGWLDVGSAEKATGPPERAHHGVGWQNGDAGGSLYPRAGHRVVYPRNGDQRENLLGPARRAAAGGRLVDLRPGLFPLLLFCSRSVRCIGDGGGSRTPFW